MKGAALLLCLLAGCGNDDPGKLIEPPCAAPPGFVIRYNVISKHYSWCHGAFCPTFETFDSKSAALASAQHQYDFEQTPHPETYDPDKDEDNWRKIENPCAKAVPESTATQQQEPSA